MAEKKKRRRRFGDRSDGYKVRTINPMNKMMPYIMPMRCDAQVFLQHKVDYELLARYIAAQSAKGERVTFMNIIVAAYVRAVSQHPEINRYIMNKQYYSRNNCTVSFTMLRPKPVPPTARERILSTR